MFRSALVGKRFGRIVVVEIVDGRRRRCRCDCGQETVVLRCNLTTGNTSSCGCLRREIEPVASLTHGATAGGAWSRAYVCWHGMLQRCLNSKRADWVRYGGRGITVCAEWRNSFPSFLADMGEPGEDVPQRAERASSPQGSKSRRSKSSGLDDAQSSREAADHD